VDVLVSSLVMAVVLAASPVGAWYTNRHPAVRNDTWGGALGLILSWIGFGIAVLFCAWRGRGQGRPSREPVGSNGAG